MARALHARSPRRAQPLVAVNCAATPDMLIESGLLGYRKARSRARPRRSPASSSRPDGGTLFLDETGELPLSVQAKLLRVLQDR